MTARALLAIVATVVACDDASVPGGAAPAATDAEPDVRTALDGGTSPDAARRPPDACLPAPEACNGVDDDCDGIVDELEARECAAECGIGLERCVDGQLECVGEADPAGETCDGADNDCDGQVDEDVAGLGMRCEAEDGCGGITVCRDGALVCDAPDAAPLEVCNGEDDDCDGEVDEDAAMVGEPCGDETGGCTPGAWVCAGGALVCEGAGGGEPETCNGVDDDCDGTTDEDIPEAGRDCDAGGACGAGTIQCQDGLLACVPLEAGGGGEPEVCDGADNDCDGQVDEDDPRLDEPCGEDTGACEPGALACIVGQLTCLGGVSAVPEACDDLDNDCDGEVDEADPDTGELPCRPDGAVCAGNEECDSGLCVNDSGARYDPDAPECAEGTSCQRRFGLDVCALAFPDCLSQRDCVEPGTVCHLVPPKGPDDLGAECRPEAAGGLPLGADCGERGATCTSRVCLAATHVCSSLCQSNEECGEGFVCALTPFRLESGDLVDVGFCLQSCGGDDDCAGAPGDTVCQYGLRVDRAAYVGYCDPPVEGGGAPGDACDLNSDPPRRCDHYFCADDDAGSYCSQGCADAGDCPDGWRCEALPAGGDRVLPLCLRPE